MPLDGAYYNALLLVHWLVRQNPNHVTSVQFSYVALYDLKFYSCVSAVASLTSAASVPYFCVSFASVA